MPDEMLRAIKKTAGTVLDFRDAFHHYFEAFKPGMRSEWASVLTPEQIAKCDRARSMSLSSQQFSDTFVFYAPIDTAHGDLTTIPLLGMLSACCMAMLLSLAGGTPIRGGICIGVGLELAANCFYGPALAGAHRIESRIAEYPRVVVSEEVSNFLERRQGFSTDSTVSDMMAEIAKSCAILVATDADSQTIVDYAGPAVRQFALGMPSQMVGAARKAFRFARHEYERFNMGPDRDPELAKRYERLCAYLEPRIALWK